MLHNEALIQQSIIQYCKYNSIFVFHIPNGGSRFIREAVNLKKQGVLAGVCDLIVVLRDKILFVEVKAPKGKQQETQIAFQKDVEKLNHKYFIVRSLDEFRELLTKEEKNND
jgi:hypothetical protein